MFLLVSCAWSHVIVKWPYYLAQSVKDLIEVNQYLSLCNLCDVIHALTCVVSDACILIREAGKHWGDYFFEISGHFLKQGQSVAVKGLDTARTGPRAMEAAARPMRPPFLA